MSTGLNENRISAARVMVVGCGALGNEVLKNLVLMGVTHIVAVDFDVVETGNLTRSILFSQADAEQRRLKVDVVAERLRQINPALEIQTICGDVAYDVGLGLIKEQDVVMGCVDSRWARFCINRLAMRAGVPWVDGGIMGLEGTARVFAPGKNCYACNLGPEGLKDMARRMPCSGIIRRQEAAGSVPTTSIVASVIGAVMVQEALKLVQQDFGTSLCGRMFYYEGEHMKVQTADYQAYDDDCPEHEQWEPIQTTAVSASANVALALHTWGKEPLFCRNHPLLGGLLHKHILSHRYSLRSNLRDISSDIEFWAHEESDRRDRPYSLQLLRKYRNPEHRHIRDGIKVPESDFSPRMPGDRYSCLSGTYPD